MSEEDSPLVREAISLLDDSDYPLRELITECFFDTRQKDKPSRRNLENAVAMISGALYGPQYITSSFSRQEEHVEAQDPIDRERIVTILTQVFGVFREADSRVKPPSKCIKKSQFNIGRYLGAILYDVLMNQDDPEAIDRVHRKWVQYLFKVRSNVLYASEAIVVPGAQNINTDRLKRVSVKVQTYLTSNRIMTKDELSLVHHVDHAHREDDSSDSDDEYETSSENDEEDA